MTDRALLMMLALMLGTVLIFALHFIDTDVDSGCDGNLVCEDM